MELNVKSFAIGLVSLVIVALLSVSVFIPILTDVSADNDTIINEGYFDMQKYQDTDNISFHWNLSDPYSFEVNGEAINFVNDTGQDISVMLGAQFVVRSNATGLSCQFYGSGSYVTANASNPDLVVTYTNGTISATNGTNSKSISNVSEIYCISADGAPYTMKKSGSVAYLDEDSTIFGSGLTYFASNAALFSNISGPIDNLSLITGAYTSSDLVVNAEEDPAHIGATKLTSIQFDATSSGGVTKSIVYSYFVVPHEITVERTAHLDPSGAALVGVIPLLILTGLVIGVVGSFIRNRD